MATRDGLRRCAFDRAFVRVALRDADGEGQRDQPASLCELAMLLPLAST